MGYNDRARYRKREYTDYKATSERIAHPISLLFGAGDVNKVDFRDMKEI